MTWGDAIIDALKNYPEKRNAKAAEVVNILVQLEGITEDRAFTESSKKASVPLGRMMNCSIVYHTDICSIGSQAEQLI